ncbi:cold shock domain-containing protein [Streptomyces phaeochromogenes]
MLMTGKILRFDEIRGYGFIVPDEGREDVFMHANDLLSEKYLYQAGGRVEFFIEEGDKGPKASEVRLVTSAAVSESPLPAHPHAEESPTPSPASSVAAPYLQEDEPTCDVLPLAEFYGEVTEMLIKADGSLTAAQIDRIRTHFGRSALAHGWVEASEG